MTNLVKKYLLILNVLIISVFASFFVSANQDEVSLADENEGKVIISIINFGRNNPFAPYKEKIRKETDIIDLSEIPYPPAYSGEQSEEYQTLINSRVNGILYDPYAKSVAIINVQGTEYMVHKGDSVLGILIEDISKNHITLKSGSNTYTVAVGDVVEGAVNYDPVERREKIFAETGYKLPDLEAEDLMKQ